MLCCCFSILFFFFNDPATTEIYTLSLHDALPICPGQPPAVEAAQAPVLLGISVAQLHHLAALLVQRSEEHTSELQSRFDLVCRLLLEKKKKTKTDREKSPKSATT